MDSAGWALLIAIISLVLAVASFGWQVFTWFRQAARITVEAEWGALSKDMKHTAASSPGTLELTEAIAQLDSEEYPHPVIKITVRNLGRSQIAVQDVSVRFPSGATYRDRPRAIQEGLPRVLQPGEATHVTIDTPALFRVWREHEPEQAMITIHGVAQLGNGKSAASNRLKLLAP